MDIGKNGYDLKELELAMIDAYCKHLSEQCKFAKILYKTNKALKLEINEIEEIKKKINKNN